MTMITKAITWAGTLITRTNHRMPQICTTRVTMLASPGLTPGRGEGITASTRARPMAAAASRAMR